MENGTIVAIIATSATNAIAFGVVLLKLGRMGQRFDLVWAWYLDELKRARAAAHRLDGIARPHMLDELADADQIARARRDVAGV